MRTNRRGFSSVIAILLTAFLVVLSAGVLFLFVAESRISRSLFDGFSAYAGAEGAMEYALLKVKNHREGFEDVMKRSSDDGKVFVSADRRAAELGYSLSAFSKSYSGTLAPGEMEMIPLFFDKGRILSTVDGAAFKDPREGSSNVEKTSDFVLTSPRGLAWNLMGSDSSGKTFGIVGTGGVIDVVGNGISATVTAGSMRSVDANDDTTDQSVGIDHFLRTYDDIYLAVTNPNTEAIEYRVDSSNGFAKPAVSVSAVGKAGKSISNLEFKENRSRHFDALRYSLFNAD